MAFQFRHLVKRTFVFLFLVIASTIASVDARRTLRQITSFSQGADHPIISTIPETEYLKGFLFELVPGR